MGCGLQSVTFRVDSVKKAFTLIELLVVIAIVALLMSILMPALRLAMKQARAVACQSTLKQWGLVFSSYTSDNEGMFISGLLNGSTNNAGMGIWWIKALQPYYRDWRLRLCTEARNRKGRWSMLIGRDSYDAWITPIDGTHFRIADADTKVENRYFLMGSYGPNGWICNPPLYQNGNQPVTNMWGREPIKDHWRTADVRGQADIPVFLDCMWVDAWPKDTDEPPPVEEWRLDLPNQNEMRRFCVDRHRGFVNVLFMDGVVRKTGLKELWTLKWHRTYDVCGPWTKCGGAQSADWPEWMRDLPTY